MRVLASLVAMGFNEVFAVLGDLDFTTSAHDLWLLGLLTSSSVPLTWWSLLLRVTSRKIHDWRNLDVA
jgi:hypothetical protein